MLWSRLSLPWARRARPEEWGLLSSSACLGRSVKTGRGAWERPGVEASTNCAKPRRCGERETCRSPRTWSGISAVHSGSVFHLFPERLPLLQSSYIPWDPAKPGKDTQTLGANKIFPWPVLQNKFASSVLQEPKAQTQPGSPSHLLHPQANQGFILAGKQWWDMYVVLGSSRYYNQWP